jgi:hypothetical protein
MKVLYVSLIAMSFLITSCNGQAHNTRTNKKYLKYKNEFDKELTKHFPHNLSSYPNEIIRSTDTLKNNICFMLYEYDVQKDKLDSIAKKVYNLSIAKYKSNDSCLLIVNRFETMKSYENRTVVEIKDSSKINQDCFKNLYPIPNFINYNSPNRDSELKLTDDFDIYILEAKSGNHWKEYKVLPNPQMPDKWKNGYSRGIALNKEKNIIIYWAIIW